MPSAMAVRNWGSTMRSLGTTKFDGALTAQLEFKAPVGLLRKLSMIPFAQELSNAWPCAPRGKVTCWARLRPASNLSREVRRGDRIEITRKK